MRIYAVLCHFGRLEKVCEARVKARSRFLPRFEQKETVQVFQPERFLLVPAIGFEPMTLRV